VRHDVPSWWTLQSRTGAAIVAGVLYERRFGTRAQLAALVLHYSGFPARLRNAWLRLRDVYRLVRR
jgi:hypothetical protein